MVFYTYKEVLYFPSAPNFFYCWCFCPSGFSNGAFHYIFWTQGARSHKQRTAEHVGHYSSLQQSSAANRGGQLAASEIEVSKPKSCYVCLAPTLETISSEVATGGFFFLSYLQLPKSIPGIQAYMHVHLSIHLGTSQVPSAFHKNNNCVTSGSHLLLTVLFLYFFFLFFKDKAVYEWQLVAGAMQNILEKTIQLQINETTPDSRYTLSQLLILIMP